MKKIVVALLIVVLLFIMYITSSFRRHSVTLERGEGYNAFACFSKRTIQTSEKDEYSTILNYKNKPNWAIREISIRFVNDDLPITNDDRIIIRLMISDDKGEGKMDYDIYRGQYSQRLVGYVPMINDDDTIYYVLLLYRKSEKKSVYSGGIQGDLFIWDQSVKTINIICYNKGIEFIPSPSHK